MRRHNHNYHGTVIFSEEWLNGSEVEYEAEVEVTPYDPGCVSGPPERCYPPEGGDVEIGHIWRIEYVVPHRSLWIKFLELIGMRTKPNPRPTRVSLPPEVEEDLFNRHGCMIEEGALIQAGEYAEDEYYADPDDR